MVGISLSTPDIAIRAFQASSPSIRQISYDWRQPILQGYDSGGSIGSALGSSSTNKTLPWASVVASGTSAITVTSAAVASGSSVVTVTATAHGLANGDYLRVTGTTTTPASQANGLWNVTVVDANTFTYDVGNNFTATSASIGGTYLKCTGTTRDFSVKLDTLPVSGSFLYYFVRGNGFSLAMLESADSVDGSAGSGSWSSITHAVYTIPGKPGSQGPQTNSSERGGCQSVSSSGWKRIRIINYDNTAALDFLMGAFKKLGGGIVPDLTINPGSSIVQQDCQPRAMRKRMMVDNSSRDPIYINLGYSGAKVSDFHTNMVNTFATWGVAPGIIITQPGPNDVSAGRPYSGDGTPSRISSALATHLSYINSTWPGTPVFVANCGHWNATVAPAVNDLSNTENGVEPYNNNDVNPWISANAAFAYNSTYGRPIFDEQLAFSLFPPATFFLDTTTHPNSQCYPYTQNWFYKINDLVTGGSATAYCEDVIVAAETAGAVPSWYKTRLTTLYGSILSGSVSSLSTRASALATAYVEPSGTKPTDMSTAPFLWIDPAKFDLLTQVSGNGYVSDMTERSANAATFTQATTTLRPTYFPPNPNNKMGRLGAGNNGTLPMNNTGGGTTVIGKLNAAGQQFMVFHLIRPLGGVTAGAFWGWGTSTTQTNLGLQLANQDDLGQAGCGQFRIIASTSGLPNGTTILTAPAGTGDATTGKDILATVLFDGTNMKLRLNGVEVASAAYTKPAWTADRFTYMGNAAGTSRMAGLSADLVARDDYNATDMATIENYLMSKNF